MKLLPLISGKITFEVSKEEFISNLEKLTKESNMLAKFSSNKEHKRYSTDIYKTSFLLEELTHSDFSRHGNIGSTSIYGRFFDNGASIILRYYITYNVLTSIIFFLAVFSTIYFLYLIIVAQHLVYSNWLMGILPYTIFIFLFNKESYGDKKFIERLIKMNNKKNLIE